MVKLLLLLITGINILHVSKCEDCFNLLKKFRYPCECFSSRDSSGNATDLNCDNIVFSNDLYSIPPSAQLRSYSQRNVGYQSLPVQLFSVPGLYLHRVDFSYNSLRRVTEKTFSNLQASLRELILADNLLGDTLNPIFSSNEFHELSLLRVLDLSGNQIRALEQGILEGCVNLQTLLLDRNRLTAVPSSSLNGPRSLKMLSLSDNRIDSVQENAFSSQNDVERIDLSRNSISTIVSRAFYDLKKLRDINLGHNRLSHLNSDVFEGSSSVTLLDLSGNFFSEFPEAALKPLKELKYLNLSSNLVQKLDSSYFTSVPYLEILDLSRNSITTITEGSFLGILHLRYLDLSVNTLRTVEDDTFEGLTNLETLLLEDNNILLIPSVALNRLETLKVLKLGYNRITAISAEIFTALSGRLTELTLNYNVIREIAPNVFQYFKKLKLLDLSGNLLLNIEPQTFAGLERTLSFLNLQGNKITTFAPEEVSSLQMMHFLDISNNQLKEIAHTSFTLMPNLLHLNFSHNYQLSSLPLALLHPLTKLLVLDASHNSLRNIFPDALARCTSLEWVSFSHNLIADIAENALEKLSSLQFLDLSFNNIANIKSGIFAALYSLKILNLRGNHLTTFKGEFFITWRSNGTSLEELDLSDNQISYLFPSSFRVHPNLKKVNAARNKFNFFPGELVVGLNRLEQIDLSGNILKTIDEFDFAKLLRLRTISFSRNQIDHLSETAFHNSTQLQRLDLSYNNLEKLDDRLFLGFNRIEILNLKGNRLSELPDSLFDRSKVRILESIDLSINKFVNPPLKSLQKQYFFLNSVDLSFNKIRDIPSDDNTMVNIKELDLSFNPLTSSTINNILGEPKTVRVLNLAGTDISEVHRLEAPFLQVLNLSHNHISLLSENVFERTTLLEKLDLSNNSIADTSSIQGIWRKTKNLQELDLSFNSIDSIVQSNFDDLVSLKKLRISHLESCSKIEKASFRNLSSLIELDIYGYPKLGYLDVAGLLRYLPSLEVFNVELKDASVGSEQLSSTMHPKLKMIGLWGRRISTISSGTFAGIKTSSVSIRISNTSLTTIPSSLLLPLPRSSIIDLYLGENNLKTLTPQIITSLDDKRNHLVVRGIEKNPIHCDCGVRALRRSNFAAGIRCVTPESLAGRLLTEVADDDLSCDPHKQVLTSTILTSASPVTPITIIKMNRHSPKYTTEPDIVWSLPSSSSTNMRSNIVTMKPPNMGMTTVLNNDDTLIIAIVGGVVAFIALLILVICIVRLRVSSPMHHGNNIAAMHPMFIPHCNNPSCPCPKLSNALYASNYTAALPPKAIPPPISPSLKPMYATVGRPYSQSSYYVPYSTEEKDYSIR